MPVSSRLRFEVFRRDNYACRYCGARAPEVEITIDHVRPVSLGGSDDPSNLVTACRNCNAGKSSGLPDQVHVEDVGEDATRWASAMRRAAEEQLRETQAREALLAEFEAAWNRWTYSDGSSVRRSENWAPTVINWLEAGVEMEVLVGLIDDVLPRKVAESRMWPYFCGAVRNVLLRRQEIAQRLLDEEGR